MIDAVVVPALAEDRGSGDITCQNAVPQGARARARLVAKAAGRLAGLDVFSRVFRSCDPEAVIRLAAADGDVCSLGQELALIEGDARALLLAERTALNLLQRMSGIATHTARLVSRAGRARVLDTRKTMPNLRALDRYAVRCGGGENHRFGLFDEAMVKENHLLLAGRELEPLLVDLRSRLGAGVRITAEARDEAEALAAAQGGADVVLLDNMRPADMEALVPRLRAIASERGRQLEVEASGNIDEGSIERVAASGVDRISVGSLTHSVAALDLSLYLEPLGG